MATTRGKKLIGIEIDKQDPDPKPYIYWMEAMEIFQKLYDANPNLGNKLLEKYSFGAHLLGNFPDYDESRADRIKRELRE